MKDRDPEDLSWMDEGACRLLAKEKTANGFNGEALVAELFFPSRGEGAKIARAKAVCAGCGVREACLGYALETEGMGKRDAQGVWGGASADERIAMQHQRRNGKANGRATREDQKAAAL